MLETQVISSLISQWLTPTSLFILLNLVLAIILLLNNHQQSKTSDNNSNDTKNEDGASLVPPPPQLTRAPSLFSRVASFNFSNYYSESHAAQSDEADRATVTVTRAPSLLYRVASFNFCKAPREVAADGEGNKGNDVKETQVSNTEKPLERGVHEPKKEEVVKVKKVNKKKKGKKAEVVAAVEEVKKEKETTTSFRGEDAHVDSKADDFINRFKQNLKMQRLDSLLRYRSYNTVAAN